jgi:ribosomal protein S18 acetylase RimI-like enzyme
MSVLRLSEKRTDEAIGVLARAFVTNPLHVAVFGAGSVAANEAFFRIGLRAMRGEKLVAADDRRIVGVVHWVDSPTCQFSRWQKLRHMPGMIRELGVWSALKVAAWLSAWAKHDPGESHVHFGPIAVDPYAQGRGVGRLLMEQFCAHLDSRGAVGYLETDRAENVAFYEKFAFVVTGTVVIYDVRNYFMRRIPSRPPVISPQTIGGR